MRVIRLKAAALGLAICFVSASGSSASGSILDCAGDFASLLQGAIQKTIRSLKVPKADVVSICDYRHFQCYQNAAVVVQALKKQGVASEDVKVLYVSRIENFSMHAIVEYRGQIFDPLRFVQGRSPIVNIEGIPIVQYFATARAKLDSKVLKIPAEFYDQNFQELGWQHFERQVSGREPLDPGSEQMSLNGYLRRFERWQQE